MTKFFLNAAPRLYLFVVVVSTFGLCAPRALAEDIVLEISCANKAPRKDKLRRVKGDGDIWVFKLVSKSPATIKIKATEPDKRPLWNYPGKDGNAPDWGKWEQGDGTATLSWASPKQTGHFVVSATYKVGGCAGAGGGVGGAGEEKEYTATWEGDVVEVESVEWEKITNPLDANPADMGGGLRIFPERIKYADDPVKESTGKVRVKAKISEKKKDVKVYFRLLDVDDPSSSAKPIDDDSSGADGNDNYSYSSANKDALTDKDGYATVVYDLGVKPGENYRVAAALESADFDKLTVDFVPGAQNEFYVPASDAQVDKFNGKIAEMLTCWRTLHIEVDSMEAINTGTTTPTNFVRGKVTQIVRSADNTYSQATLNKNLTLGADLGTGVDDASLNLDSPTPANGRFEQGTITVGNNAVTANLKGNGNSYLRTTTAGFTLPFTVTQAAPGNTTISGTVLETTTINVGGFIVDKTLTPGLFDGGTLLVAGQNFTVATNTENRISVTAEASLPFVLQDDDDNSNAVLPHTPPSWTDVVALYKPAYIVPLVDGGDKADNNKETVAFIPNVRSDGASSTTDYTATVIRSKNAQESRSDYQFWTVSVLFAFQPQTESAVTNTPGGPRGDVDSNNEGNLGGVANPSVGGALMFRGTFSEGGSLTDSAYEQRVLAHEIAHLLQCPDRYEGGLGYSPTKWGGLMQSTAAGQVFIDDDLKILRGGVLNFR